MSGRERPEGEPECRRMRELAARSVASQQNRSFPQASACKQINRQIASMESIRFESGANLQMELTDQQALKK
jgi:hypothetical protein